MNNRLFLTGINCKRLFCLQLVMCVIGQATAQEQSKGFEVYGYIKADIGYSFDQINPDWIDVMRVTKLPAHEDQFAPDGKIYFSLRQTRLGLNSWSETPLGQLKANFEFDLFGVGPDVGQTVFRFRKAYVELGRFTVGQTESLFSDVDVTPNTLDFGAPPSRAFLRSIQVRYMVTEEKLRWGIALEDPGAVSDEGIYANRIELENVKSHFQLPDLSAEYRRITKNGYIELAGVLKVINWKNTIPSAINLSGSEIGWGLNFSATEQLSPQTLLKGQFVYGEGIQNHLTDAGPDIGIENNFGDPTTPVLGASLPVVGGLVFVEHFWNSHLSSTLGYSRIRIYNSDAQAGSAFRAGNYATLNLLYHPFTQSYIGTELIWGDRGNFHDGFNSSALKVQFSIKHNIFHAFNK
jgi:hypothetical protein